MYTFADRDGGSLTLRPEATAGIVRAVIEHNLLHTDPALKVYAMGPMFRRERPQKGRYRQFHQVDVEAFGFTSPTIDAEMIELALAYLDACGVRQHELVLNSVGDRHCRPAYVERLREALPGPAPSMCADCQRRAETNPLRVLDCKVPEDQATIDALPRITDHLCEECAAHFAEVRRQLDLLGIPYRLSHRLVRGLDYYVRTTFEVTSDRLGAQSSVLGGGRYDGLVKDLGGPDAAGIGFAVGMERLALLAAPARERSRAATSSSCPSRRPRSTGRSACSASCGRRGSRALLDPEGRSFKSRMKQADKLGARFVAILGDDEMARGVWTVRDMARSEQQDVPEDEDPRPPEGEGEWLSPWATSSGPTTAGSCARTHVGKTVTLMGWAANRRDLGGVIFVDLRDREGICQVVARPEVSRGRPRRRRPRALGVRGRGGGRGRRALGRHREPRASTRAGSRCWPGRSASSRRRRRRVFPIEDEVETHEEIRLKHRYLDLRRPRMQRNLRLRHQVTMEVRRYLDEQGFYEIETPMLGKSTPEGARDYLVPSRRPPRALLRAAAVAAAVQAAADGRRASTSTSRSPAASATRTCAPTASPSSPRWTSRCRSRACSRSCDLVEPLFERVMRVIGVDGRAARSRA